MTNGFTTWLINKRTQLFAHASPVVSSFWLMHMIEETEHKTVAFDAYMAYSGQYLPRVVGVFHGSLHVLGYGLIGMVAALKKDGNFKTRTRVAEVFREMFSLIRNVGPFMLRALLPGHNPRQDDDPQWMKDWLAGHKKLPEGALIPLIDTDDPLIPVPFGPSTH